MMTSSILGPDREVTCKCVPVSDQIVMSGSGKIVPLV